MLEVSSDEMAVRAGDRVSAYAGESVELVDSGRVP